VARRSVARTLVLVAAVLITIGLPLLHVHRIAQPSSFSARAASLLDDRDVRDALADSALDAVDDAVREVRPSAVPAVRSAIEPRVARVIASPQFRRAWRGTARRGLRQVLDDRRDRVAFTVTDVAGLTEAATGALPAQLDALLRDIPSVEIFAFDRSRTTAARTSRLEDVAGLGLPLLAVGALALLAALVVAPDRRATALRVGLAVAGSGAVVAIAEVASRAVATGAAASGPDRRIATAVWDELLGGLRVEVLALLVAGLLVAAVAGLAGRSRPQGRPAYPLG
jgi:hypothetical protein